MISGSNGIVSRSLFTILTQAKFAGTGSVFFKLPLPRCRAAALWRREFFPPMPPGTRPGLREKPSRLERTWSLF